MQLAVQPSGPPLHVKGAGRGLAVLLRFDAQGSLFYALFGRPPHGFSLLSLLRFEEALHWRALIAVAVKMTGRKCFSWDGWRGYV